MAQPKARPDSVSRSTQNIQNNGGRRDIIRFVSGVIAVILALCILWYFRSIVTYIILAAVISLVLTPVKRFLKNLGIGKFKVGDSLSSFISILIFIAVVVSFFALFIPLVIEQARIISNIDYQQISTNLQEPIKKVNDFAARFQLNENPDENFMEGMLNRARNVLSSQTVLNFFNSLLGFTGNFLAAFFSIIFVLFFFLRDEQLFENLLKTISPDRYEYKVVNIFAKAKFYLMRYFLGILLQVTIVTIIVTVGMLILSVENALIIGFFAGIVNLIPYVGPFIGATFGLYVGITTNLGLDFYSQILPMCGGIVLVFFVAQMLDNVLLSPLIHSSSVKAHPLEIFIVILAAAKIGGAIGMIIAIPAYTILRVFAKEFLSEFKIVRSLTQDI